MFRRTLIALSILFLYTQAGAQVTLNSVEAAWRYADEHNVSLRIARYDATRAVLSRKQAYGALLPQLTASATYTDNMSLQTTLLPGIILGRPDGTYIPVQFGQKYIYTAGITAQMDVLNLQSWFNTQTAKISMQMSKDSLINAKKNIYQQVATQYYSVLLMNEAARLAVRSAAIADSAYESANNKFKTGTISEATLDVSKLNKERAEQTLISAQYQVATAKNNLKILLDLSVNDSIVINDQLSASTIDAGGSFKEDPAVKLAYDAMKISISQYRSYNSLFVPTLSVLYSNSTQQNDNKFEPLQSGGPAWYPAQYWSLRASWNIFSGGTRYFQSRRNRIAIDERRLQYESAMKQSTINDENLRLNYRKTAALLEKSKNIMELSFDNYSHITNRYQEGLSSLDDRLNAFTDYISYQNQYLNSLSDMLVQLYQVKIRQLDLK